MTKSSRSSTRSSRQTGTPVASGGTQPDHAPLANKLLKRLYADMLRCRIVQEAAAAKARSAGAKLRPATRREAIEVGCVIELQPDDVALCPESSVAAPLVLGTPASALIQRFGRRASSLKVAGFSRIVTLPTSADALAVAAGIGYSYRHLQKPNVVFALDAGTVPARALEAFALIARDRLPVIAVLENLGSDSHPARLVDAGRKYGIPCITVDANDGVAVYRVAREAIHHARAGRGATIIDSYPLPLPGDRPTDGLAAMEHYMKRFAIWSDEWKAELQAKYAAEIRK